MTITSAVLAQIRDPAFLQAYRIWIQNPVTLKVLAVLQTAVDSDRLMDLRSEGALRYSGAVDEAREIMAWLRNLDVRVEAQLQRANEVAGLEANYGVQRPKEIPK
jgi:hypothetical protein